MKIGIFDPYLDDLGGGEKYMMKIAQCLSKNNDVSVFWDNKKDLEELTERFSLDLSKVKLEKNIFSSRINLLQRLIETRKFDIIIFLSDGSIPLTLSKKTFIHLQQPISISNIDIKTKFKISRINRFFCNSYYSKSYVDKSLRVNSAVLYPPVEVFPKKTKKENIILHVGRFRVRDVTISGIPIGDYKKQSFMIEVFKKMIKKGVQKWRFVVAVSVKKGDEKVFKSLQKSAEGFPIEFVVNKNNKELWEFYNKAKIYWHASGFGEDLAKYPEKAEHFGISTVEAMGAGAVPVVINAGGQKEIVENGENGYLWDNIDEFLKCTEDLINDQNLWSKMSQSAIKRSKFFSGDRFCEELKEIIK